MEVFDEAVVVPNDNTIQRQTRRFCRGMSDVMERGKLVGVLLGLSAPQQC